MALQFFSRKSGEQVLARGSEKEKQNKRAMQLPLNAFLHLGQICYSNDNQRARCFGWPSTRLCQLHSTLYLRNPPLVFTDAILSKPLPAAHVPFASTVVLGTKHTPSCQTNSTAPYFPSVLPLHDKQCQLGTMHGN